ncbi:hypothetical protein OG900_36230 [Streptomyces sp. NBC_00433]
MNNKRILAGIALTAGLGLTGVATAPVSGAATTPSASGSTFQTQPAKAAPGHKTGKRIVCVVRIEGKGGPTGGLPKLPPLPGKPGKPGKAGPGAPGKTTVKIVNGKVYVNGKLVPKGTVDTSPKGGKCPPPPPLPPKGGKGGKGGKGVVIVERDGGGTVAKGAPGAGEAGLTTSGASTSAVLG